jgi:SAM-dependent methyltransferase
MAIKYPFILEILDLYKSDSAKALDIGAGTGIYGDDFAPGMYTGIDVEASSNEKVIQASALDMPFPSDSFDMAFGVASIYLAGANCLSEIHRVLKPGGVFLIFDYQRKVLKRLRHHSNIDHAVWSPRELRHEIRRSGFKEIKRISHRPVYRSYYLQPISALKLNLRGSWVIFACRK